MDWSKSGSLLAHKFGHVLGATLHDDELYPADRFEVEELLMWTVVNIHPFELKFNLF